MNIFVFIFDAILYQPMLNFLVWVYIYTNSFGIAVIALTLLIKLVTNPLNEKALQSQVALAEIQPRLKEIQAKHKDNPEKQAQEMMALYKEKKFNPFSGIFLLFIQIPIIWALFNVFKAGIVIDPKYLYSFIALPQNIDPMFLGINLAIPNIWLAIITGAAQYFQAKTAMPNMPKSDSKDQASQISEMVQKQMIFLLPVITFFVLYNLPAALGLYWLITTVFTIYQQKQIFKKK